ncbi:uncharacterized protein [Eurosta solidaginis]|uniref:uncharacterized protein n=1 Tax=Eurosta solidaginis TaxID=178769 RepID=UPI0035317399
MSNSERTNLKIPSIALLKNSIYNILTNINDLERSLHDDRASVANVAKLKHDTDKLLKRLENAPLEYYAKKLNKRKQLRRRKKLRLNHIKKCFKNNETVQKSRTTKVSPPNETSTSSVDAVELAPIKSAKSRGSKLHNRLLRHHDAQRFLRTFELLKMLHYTRSQDSQSTREFAEQLSDLRATWSKVLEDNRPECRHEQQVEDQWNEVFFGARVHSYYGGEPPKTSDFLRVRHIWDSYLTRSKQGSSIPCGWVLPHENALAVWQKYRTT